ncbi:MAG: ribosomal protein S18-alanine N-acetyltransferase [Lachnospiraceae bacterium]|nr:ribosomal protein S18-alanine N-acetyltransferase [Lachnospiraceae bacterium]MBQ8263120.1 ribosomal protein S18-alanine N-acetyltransferase [Lachnospiraceae bacterium]
MLIRPMEARDLDGATQLERDNFSMPWSRSDFADALTKEYYHFYIAEEDGVVLANAGFIQSFDEADITNVAVCASRRREGIAEHLLQKLMEEGKRCGVLHFSLEVRESNEAAIGLYKKLGFIQEGIRKDFYDKPRENAVIMWKH